MDEKELVVDNDGFLIPQSSSWSDIISDDSWLNSSCDSMEANSFDSNGNFHQEVPDTPFSKLTGSSSTLATEAMTGTFSDSQSDLFMSPNLFRSPSKLSATFDMQCNDNFANFDLVSNVPESKNACGTSDLEKPTFIIEPGEIVLDFERIRSNTPISIESSAAVRGRNVSSQQPFNVFGEKKPRIPFKPKNSSDFFRDQSNRTQPDKGKSSSNKMTISKKKKMRRPKSSPLLPDFATSSTTKDKSPRAPTTPVKSPSTLKARLRRQRSELTANQSRPSPRPAPNRRGVERGWSEASGTLNRPKVRTRGRKHSVEEQRTPALSRDGTRTPRRQKPRKNSSSGPSPLSKVLQRSTTARKKYPILEIDHNAMDEISVLTPAAPSQLEDHPPFPRTPSTRSRGSKTSEGTGPTVASSTKSSTASSIHNVACLEKEILAILSSPDMRDSLRHQLLAAKKVEDNGADSPDLKANQTSITDLDARKQASVE